MTNEFIHIDKMHIALSRRFDPSPKDICVNVCI